MWFKCVCYLSSLTINLEIIRWIQLKDKSQRLPIWDQIIHYIRLSNRSQWITILKEINRYIHRLKHIKYQLTSNLPYLSIILAIAWVFTKVTFFTSLVDWHVSFMKALRVSSKVDCEEEAGAWVGAWYAGVGCAGRP
jgi:hypothetical protein